MGEDRGRCGEAMFPLALSHQGEGNNRVIFYVTELACVPSPPFWKKMRGRGKSGAEGTTPSSL